MTYVCRVASVLLGLLLLGPVAHAEQAAPAAALETPKMSPAAPTESYGPFKNFRIYKPEADPKSISHVVLFLSGDGNWDQGVEDIARQFVNDRTVVIGIDLPAYMVTLAKGGGKCSYPAGDLESLAQYVEKMLNMDRYIAPIIAGYSSGATLAYAALVQAPKGTFSGAVGLGFCPDLPIPKPMCKGAGLTSKPNPHFNPKAPRVNPDLPVKGVLFDPVKQVSAPWIVMQGGMDKVCFPDKTAQFVSPIGNAHLIALPKVGHGFAVNRSWAPKLKDVFETIDAAAPPPPPPAPQDLAGLPLYEVPATANSSDWMAVFYTGDGGWAELDKEVSHRLAAGGVGVVAVSSLRYFWSRKPPEDAAPDLARIIRYYGEVWHKKHVMLVGYSFGADVIPAIYNKLPADERATVGAIGLIGPSPRAQFEIKMVGWLGANGKGDPTLPQFAMMHDMPIVCIHGTDEADSLCPELDAKSTMNVAIGGGHHFGGDYDALSKALLAATKG